MECLDGDKDISVGANLGQMAVMCETWWKKARERGEGGLGVVFLYLGLVKEVGLLLEET